MTQKQKTLLIAGSLLLILGGAGFFLAPRFMNTATEEPTAPAPETEDVAIEEQLTPEERDWQRYRHINEIRIALNGFFNENHAYPDVLGDIAPLYITEVPVDPLNKRLYDYTSKNNTYIVLFTLEEGVLALAPGEHYLTPNGFNVDDAGNAPYEPTPTISIDSPPPEDAPVDEEEEVNEDGIGADDDADGLSLEIENTIGTDPDKFDTDRDGLSDGVEVEILLTNPLNADSDNDGFSDGDELYSGFDPLGISDRLPDADGDGLADLYEEINGLDPSNADMDKDGLSDGDELRVFNTSPIKADSDDDGFTDVEELLGGFEPFGEGDLTQERRDAINAGAIKYSIHPPTSISTPL